MSTALAHGFGLGMYPVADVARLLRLPDHQVRRWITHFSKEKEISYAHAYSWKEGQTSAISFMALVEFFVFAQFKQAGVSTRQIFKAHQELVNEFETPFPFADLKLLQSIKTDNKRIFFERNESIIIALDGSRQINLPFIRSFFNKLTFGPDHLPTVLYPLGKEKHIELDPTRQSGRAVISGTNVFPETLFRLVQAGDSIPFVAFSYDLKEEAVHDAIEFCTAA